MAANENFGVHVVKFNSTVLNGTVTQPLTRAAGVLRPIADGETDPGVAALATMVDGVALGCLGVDDLFAITGLRGAAVTNVVWWAVVRGAAAKSGSSVHTKFTAATAFVAPGAITCEHAGNAAMSAIVTPYKSDGTNPIAVATNQALSDTTGNGATKLFTLGSLEVNGTTIGGLTSFSMEFGVSTSSVMNDSAIHPKEVVCESASPVLRFSTTDIETAANLVGAGVALSSLTFYLRKRSGAGFVADGTAEHIKFEAENGVVVPDGMSGDRMRVFSFRVEPYKSGSTDPVTITASSAIS